MKRTPWIGLVLALCARSAAGQEVFANGMGGDTVVASDITTLALEGCDGSSISLSWTVPIPPNAFSTLDRYELKITTQPVFNWDSASRVAILLPIGTGGQVEHRVIPVTLLDAETYRFAMKAHYNDETAVGIWSNPSNIVVVDLDTTPPAVVDDLAVVSADASSLRIGWTAPGEDGSAGGPASGYEMRRSLSAPGGDVEAWWQAATAVANLPDPGAPGTRQELLIPGLEAGTVYYLVLKSADDRSNWSGGSNVLVAPTLQAGSDPDPAPGSAQHSSPCSGSAMGAAALGAATILLIAAGGSRS